MKNAYFIFIACFTFTSCATFNALEFENNTRLEATRLPAEASVVKAGPSSTSCNDLFKDILDLKSPIVYTVRNWKSPEIHIGNLMQSRLPMGTRFYREGITERSVGEGNLFYFPETSKSAFIMQIAPNKHFFSVQSLLGPRFFRFGETSVGLWFEEVTLRSTSFFKPGPLQQDPSRIFLKLDQISNDFIERISSLQKRVSSTFIKNQNGDEEGLKQANADMVNLVLTSRRITLEFIEKINKNLIQRELHGDKALAAGIIRGVQPRMVKDAEKQYLVDLSQTEVKNTVPAFFYIPATLVPVRMEEWIAKANAINHQSKFADIISLYRDFVIVHPFVDGNGRTGRVLLDGLLLKAGFPPVPHDEKLTSDVLFKSLDDVVEDFKRAYDNE